ncbi:MAG: B3/4 domain-containing protein [Planctomycetota bacterium]
MRISLDTDQVALGVVELDAIEIPESAPASRPRPLPGTDLQDARRLYRAVGLDPTRTRPSSEALWRRLRRGEPLPRINALVDVVNFCSVSLLLPFGAYDAGRIEGDVVLRLGREGEGYEGIGKPRVNLSGRYALCDARGPFGNPTSDSKRTRITPGTRRALVTIFAPRDHPLDRVEWVAAALRARVGGRVATQVLR